MVAIREERRQRHHGAYVRRGRPGSGGDGSNQGGAPAATPRRVREAREGHWPRTNVANERASVRVWHSESDKVMIEIRSPARLLVLSRFVQLLEQEGLHSFEFTASTNDCTNVRCVRAEVEAHQLSVAQLHALQSMLADQILQSAQITTSLF